MNNNKKEKYKICYFCNYNVQSRYVSLNLQIYVHLSFSSTSFIDDKKDLKR